jgi:hypothetical protein
MDLTTHSRCHKCTAENSIGMANCQSCGHALDQDNQEELTHKSSVGLTWRCVCGEVNVKSDEACRSFGESQGSKESQRRREMSKSSLFLLLLLKVAIGLPVLAQDDYLSFSSVSGTHLVSTVIQSGERLRPAHSQVWQNGAVRNSVKQPLRNVLLAQQQNGFTIREVADEPTVRDVRVSEAGGPGSGDALIDY